MLSDSFNFNDALSVASKLSYAELEDALICSFCPSIEYFDSIEDARRHYAQHIVDEHKFFTNYYNTIDDSYDYFTTHA